MNKINMCNLKSTGGTNIKSGLFLISLLLIFTLQLSAQEIDDAKIGWGEAGQKQKVALKSVTDPEGIYIAFPFELKDGVLAFDVQGGEIRAGIDQIPGSTNDWNVVQNYASLKNNDAQILLSSPEIPLMQFGGINTGRFEYGAPPVSTHIYGWPMNNY